MSRLNETRTLPLSILPQIKVLYDYEVNSLGGDFCIPLTRYKDKVVLIVNIALGDPLAARHLKQLNEMAVRFAGKLCILAFPCNQFAHKNNFTGEEEMLNIMKYVRPGDGFEPQFTVLEALDVNGSKCHPLWKFLRESIVLPNDDPLSFTPFQHISWDPVSRSDVAWNFEKFLIAPNGRPYKRFSSKFQVSALMEDIKQLIQKFNLDSHQVDKKCMC